MSTVSSISMPEHSMPEDSIHEPLLAAVPDAVSQLDALALEWQPLLALVSGYAVSAVGRAGITSLVPSTAQAWIEREHQLVAELRTLVEAGVTAALGGLFDPTEVLAKAQIPDAALEPGELQAVARLAYDVASWQTLLKNVPARNTI